MLRKYLPLGLIALGIVGFFALGWDRYLSFEALREHRHTLLGLVDERPLVTALGFLVIYAVATALSLPGGTVLSIAGGFLFSTIAGTAVVVLAATLGATAIFLIAKSALGDPLRARAGPWLERMAEGFRDNALSYLLVLRLVPLFPFFVVNLVPAFLGVSLGTYVVGTFLGIIPGAFVFVSVGAGLGSVFDSGESFTAEGILTPQIVVALVGLSVLALVPVVYKRLRRRTA